MAAETPPTDYELFVRASSLGMLAACPLAWAGNRFRGLLIKAHPDVAPDDLDFKPWMGTALHRVMELDLSVEAEMRAEITRVMDHPSRQAGFYTSERYATLDDIVGTTMKMVQAFRATSHAAPWMGEGRKAAGSKFEVGLAVDRLGRSKLPIELRGHVDCVAANRVLDLKTGAVDDRYLYPAQLTAYRMMLQEAGMPVVDKKAAVIKVERPKTPKFRVPIKVRNYVIDTKPHEKRVVNLVRKAADILDKKDQWKDDFTRIESNPDSRACAFCKLRNTSACPATAYEEFPDKNAPTEVE